MVEKYTKLGDDHVNTVLDRIDEEYVKNPIIHPILKANNDYIIKYKKTKLKNPILDSNNTDNFTQPKSILDSNNADNLTQSFDTSFVPESDSDIESESKSEGELKEFKEGEPKTDPEVGLSGLEHKGEPIDDIIEEEVIPTSQTDRQNIGDVTIETVEDVVPINQAIIYPSQMSKPQLKYTYELLFKNTNYNNKTVKELKEEINKKLDELKLKSKLMKIPKRIPQKYT